MTREREITANSTTLPGLCPTSPYTGEAFGKGAASPVTRSRFITCLPITPFKSIPCSPAPAGEKAVARWPHPRVQGRSPGRRPPRRNGGTFSLPFWCQKGRTKRQAAAAPATRKYQTRQTSQPLRRCAAPPLTQGRLPGSYHLSTIPSKIVENLPHLPGKTKRGSPSPGLPLFNRLQTAENHFLLVGTSTALPPM